MGLGVRCRDLAWTINHTVSQGNCPVHKVYKPDMFKHFENLINACHASIYNDGFKCHQSPHSNQQIEMTTRAISISGPNIQNKGEKAVTANLEN